MCRLCGVNLSPGQAKRSTSAPSSCGLSLYTIDLFEVPFGLLALASKEPREALTAVAPENY
jgi:hypothetical protein